MQFMSILEELSDWLGRWMNESEMKCPLLGYAFITIFRQFEEENIEYQLDMDILLFSTEEIVH